MIIPYFKFAKNLFTMLEFVITFFSFLITLLVGLITAAVVYARWHYGTLEKIKGLQAVIKPYFVGGSDPYIYKKVVQNEDAKNVQKYGKIYGVSHYVDLLLKIMSNFTTLLLINYFSITKEENHRFLSQTQRSFDSFWSRILIIFATKEYRNMNMSFCVSCWMCYLVCFKVSISIISYLSNYYINWCYYYT